MDETTGGGLWAVLDALGWFFGNIAMSFYNLGYALTHPASWLDWSDSQAVMRVVYYGASVELFFVVFTMLIVLTGLGMWRRNWMWNMVVGLEAFANATGRFFAWAGLIMVLQQVVIVLIQRVFSAASISVGFGLAVDLDVSWWSEELKLYNAIVVALCVSYTYVQGGHVRVDLFYAPARFRTKRVIDMFGALVFMMPTAVLIWLYAWFFLWRHLIVPKPSASDRLDQLLNKARALRWNVETIGFSPNGFNAYFLFKILICAFAGLVFLHAVAVFWRSWLEFREGPESENKRLDRDTLGEGEEAYEGAH